MATIKHISKYSVLLVDNDADFLNTRAEYLQKAGYRVTTADTIEKARRLMADMHLHLAILDIRLVNDDDEKDTSGLTLAKDPAYHGIPKIILTNYPKFEDVREALILTKEGLPPAVDFVEKRAGPEQMIQSVHNVITRYVKINRALEIVSDQGEGLFLFLIGLLQPHLSPDSLVQRADELKDLFGRIFYEYRQIRVEYPLWCYHEKLCVRVFTQSLQGVVDSRLVVCGNRSLLQQEFELIREFAPDLDQGTRLLDLIQTAHFGALVYAWREASLEPLLTLRELFEKGKDKLLKTACDRLMKTVLPLWRQRGAFATDQSDLRLQYLQLASLKDQQAVVHEKLKALIHIVRPLTGFEVEYTGPTLTYHIPGELPVTYPNPVNVLYQFQASDTMPVVHKLSPGWLSADNVLVDGQGKSVCLTDFSNAGPAPQWWDFACLEAVIRFDLSQSPHLSDWFVFEKCLTASTKLDEHLSVRDLPGELRPSLVLINQIRQHARVEVGHHGLEPYHAALLAWVVRAITLNTTNTLCTHVEQIRGAHLLIAAGMIANVLSHPAEPAKPHAGETLHLNETGEAFIGSKKIDQLAGQELDLLKCLINHPTNVVSRKTIVEEVFKEKFESGNEQQESRINSLIRRLRMRVEPNPDRSRYLRTLKGRGYRLYPDGKDKKSG